MADILIGAVAAAGDLQANKIKGLGFSKGSLIRPLRAEQETREEDTDVAF